MVCAPVRSIIPSLKLGDYLSVQAHKPCSISHLFPKGMCNQVFASSKHHLPVIIQHHVSVSDDQSVKMKTWAQLFKASLAQRAH